MQEVVVARAPSRRDALGLIGGGLAALALPSCGAGDSSWEDEARAAIERGVAWLRTRQSEDGAFRSGVYGLLARGYSLTGLVLVSLSDAGASGDAATDRALEFLAAARDSDGALGFEGPAPDYPVYATAMAVSSFVRLRPPGWEKAVAPMAAWLETQQYRAEDGWTGHPAEGGFGMGSRERPAPPRSGHVDLSMSRRAIEALVATGRPAGGPVLSAAKSFVLRCRAAGGGFLYSPAEAALNKGAPGTAYGSATADGLIAMSALGAVAADADTAPAVAALRTMHRTDENPGIAPAMQPHGAAMKGYYRAAAARAFAAFGGPDGWAEGIARAVVAEQGADGSWRNPLPLQKEDDPLIATSFALTALAVAVRN